MKLLMMNLRKHDLKLVSELIYETDKSLFGKFLDKNQDEALNKLRKLIIAKNNAYSHENIYVAEDDDGSVMGVLVGFRGDYLSLAKEAKIFNETLQFKDVLKLIFIKPIYDKITASSIENDDFYIGNLAVNPNIRGHGVGTKMLKSSLEIANHKNCKRVLLDVIFTNIRAKNLYTKIGFKVCGEKKYKWLSSNEGTYAMDYSLNK